MYVATRDSIKKNNKLSKVDGEKIIKATKDNIFLEKLNLKKNQPFSYFYFCIIKFPNLIKSFRSKFLVNNN